MYTQRVNYVQDKYKNPQSVDVMIMDFADAIEMI